MPDRDSLNSRLAPLGMEALGSCKPMDVALDWQWGPEPALIIPIISRGADFWHAFEKERPIGPDPMNSWTSDVLAPVASEFGAQVVYPFSEPFPPIQRWAIATGRAFKSAMGLLIHPIYGLWHAYRGALLFSEDAAARFSMRVNSSIMASPCDSCADKPCLSTCPVGAYRETGFDWQACIDYLPIQPDKTCFSKGCLARNACPIGIDHRYLAEQQAFHQKAFSRIAN